MFGLKLEIEKSYLLINFLNLLTQTILCFFSNQLFIILFSRKVFNNNNNYYVNNNNYFTLKKL